MGRKKHTCCSICKLDFNEENKDLFPIEKNKLKDGNYSEHHRSSRCKKCSSNILTQQSTINRNFIKNLKEKTPCRDCKKNYPYYVMQFDHLKDKKFHIGGSSKSMKLLLEEINKCDIVCANCHAERTYSRRKLK